jgi:hypothetical protein
MSTGAPTLERSPASVASAATAASLQAPSATNRVVDVSNLIQDQDAGNTPSIWGQVDRLLRATEASRQLGHRVPMAQPGVPQTKEFQGWRAVAPGIMVSAAEYEQRFDGITLDAFRRTMTPSVFQAYVRFLGIIPGGSGLDVVEIARLPDD